MQHGPSRLERVVPEHISLEEQIVPGSSEHLNSEVEEVVFFVTDVELFERDISNGSMVEKLSYIAAIFPDINGIELFIILRLKVNTSPFSKSDVDSLFNLNNLGLYSIVRLCIFSPELRICISYESRYLDVSWIILGMNLTDFVILFSSVLLT